MYQISHRRQGNGKYFIKCFQIYEKQLKLHTANSMKGRAAPPSGGPSSLLENSSYSKTLINSAQVKTMDMKEVKSTAALLTSLVHSHWSRNVEAWLSLVESVAGASSLMP